MTTPAIDSKSKQLWAITGGAMLLFVVVLYYQSFCWLLDYYWNYRDYVHGYIIPFFSAWLLWDRRDMLKLDQLKGSYWGVPIVVATVIWAIYVDYEFRHVIKAFTLIPLIGGLVLLVGGWHAIRWAWPGIAFLVFMIPVPGRYASLLSQELQAIGTRISVFVLQTLGVPAVADGNIIQLTKSRLGVVEACSGIKMLVLFFAASVGTALYLRHRDPIIRIVIGLSAPPIAIIANVARIVITAMIYENVSEELGEKIFHDLAGWLMMPIAIALLWLETALLDRLFVVPEQEAPLAFGAAVPRAPEPGAERTIPPGGTRAP
ncbi:MAG: exosortase/archaeosortase family protein [Pirellulaceae bacterium]|nr:exosortase/archaeosortase family protein [Pirellulaceae bacterium]